MTFDHHLGKFLVRFQGLPLQTYFPVFEETSRPAFALIIPPLTLRLFQQVRRVQLFSNPKKTP